MKRWALPVCFAVMFGFALVSTSEAAPFQSSGDNGYQIVQVKKAKKVAKKKGHKKKAHKAAL